MRADDDPRQRLSQIDNHNLSTSYNSSVNNGTIRNDTKPFIADKINTTIYFPEVWLVFKAIT